MFCFRSKSQKFVLELILGLWVVTAQSTEFRYRYVAIDQIELPPEVIFFDPQKINNGEEIYGNAYQCSNPTCDAILAYTAIYANGALTVHQPGIVYTANEGGTIGGSVFIDPENFLEQAALFREDQVILIPPQPGELTSFVTALNDSGSALVTSYDTSYQPSYLLYRNGDTIPLDFGPTVTDPFFLQINNKDIISGTTYASGSGRGFRFDPRTSETTLLDPLPTEPDSWALDINNSGSILGYSFVPGGVERIGTWNREGEFKTLFVEGIPQFPTLSNRLLFNNNGLVVITDVSRPSDEKTKSYLVPKPGVRLNLADLVVNLPPDQNPNLIIDMNDQGDMIGWSVQDFVIQGVFLLERTGVDGQHAIVTNNEISQDPSTRENWLQTMPPAAAAAVEAMLSHRPSAPLKSRSSK